MSTIKAFAPILTMAQRSKALCCLPQLPKGLRDYADKNLIRLLALSVDYLLQL
ncbi:MAG: hypothetical protein ACMUIL_12240 [bacterium]